MNGDPANIRFSREGADRAHRLLIAGERAARRGRHADAERFSEELHAVLREDLAKSDHRDSQGRYHDGARPRGQRRMPGYRRRRAS